MLPLLITFLLAMYVLGPGLFARWIIGFNVPRRAVVESRSEEWLRSVVWCFGPLYVAWKWAQSTGVTKWYGGRTTVETVFSGLYDESFFLSHRDEFFYAMGAFWQLNWHLLWRLYVIVALGAFGLILLIRNYGVIRGRVDKHPFYKGLLTALVLPRVSDWHVLLSRMLLPSKDFEVVLDILTKGDQLYQGRLADKTLGPDGSLVKITLAEPLKFRRQRYLAALQSNAAILPGEFWHKIPGENFVLMASEIASLNVRHVRLKITSEEDKIDVVGALKDLLAQLERAKTDQPRSSDQFSK